jgi:hypothetical protein
MNTWWNGGVPPRFLTSALGGGVISFTPQPLYTLGKKLPVSTGQDAGWAYELVWILWRRENLAPARNQTPAHSPSLPTRAILSPHKYSLWGKMQSAFNAKTSSIHSNHHALRGWTPCIPDHSTRRLVVQGPFYQHLGPQCLRYVQLNYNSSFVS